MILRPQEVEASWYGRIRLNCFYRVLLNFLAKIYGLVIFLRQAFYRWGVLKQSKLPVPVIVVGNIIVGGAGKTPLTRSIAFQLKALGWNPGIISRGYGRKVSGVRAVGVMDNPDYVGDEPLLYAQDGFPVFIGEKRAEAGRALLAANPKVDILLADDGLQHLRLYRDMEIVVFDQRGQGNGRLLPAGPLREPMTRLKNPLVSGLVVQGQPDQSNWPLLPQFQMVLNPEQPYLINDPSRAYPFEHFKGQSVIALAGIGHPEKFFNMLKICGLDVREYRFSDHHDFSPEDIPITSLPVMMTEKDAVKCRKFSDGHDNWFVVPVSSSFSPELPLSDWLQNCN